MVPKTPQASLPKPFFAIHLFFPFTSLNFILSAYHKPKICVICAEQLNECFFLEISEENRKVERGKIFLVATIDHRVTVTELAEVKGGFEYCKRMI